MKRLMFFLCALVVAFAMTTSSFAWQTSTGQEQKKETKKEKKSR
ncbi:MAG TPA: hypothetical protein VEV41_18320 [Terriglobales bacterium]|nr:hypothetical protein [Terriglobales bacterium]